MTIPKTYFTIPLRACCDGQRKTQSFWRSKEGPADHAFDRWPAEQRCEAFSVNKTRISWVQACHCLAVLGKQCGYRFGYEQQRHCFSADSKAVAHPSKRRMKMLHSGCPLGRRMTSEKEKTRHRHGADGEFSLLLTVSSKVAQPSRGPTFGQANEQISRGVPERVDVRRPD